MKNTILIALLLCLSLIANAQQDESRIENLKKEYITKELQLTPQEAEAFFPLYNEYTQKLKEARKSLRKEMKTQPGETSVDKIMDKEQDVVDLRKEYWAKFQKVIPEAKVVRLIEVEKKFKMMLIQKLKAEN